MYTSMKVDWADGTRKQYDIEPCRRPMAMELMRYVFYHQTEDTGGSQITCVRLFEPGNRKPLVINRNAL